MFAGKWICSQEQHIEGISTKPWSEDDQTLRRDCSTTSLLFIAHYLFVCLVFFVVGFFGEGRQGFLVTMELVLEPAL